MKNAVSKKSTHAKSAVIYGRVSTINQKENETVDLQLKRLRRYCKDYGYHIYHEYVDEALGGSDKQRAYNLIDYLQTHAKEIDYVIFTVFDRFSRNYSLCGYLEFSCLRLDIELLAIEQEDLFGAEPDPMRDLQRSIKCEPKIGIK